MLIAYKSKTINLKNNFKKYRQSLQNIKTLLKDNGMTSRKKLSDLRDKLKKILRVFKHYNMSIKGVNRKSIKKKNKFGNCNQILLNWLNPTLISSLSLINSKILRIKEPVEKISDTWVQQLKNVAEIVMISSLRVKSSWQQANTDL